MRGVPSLRPQRLIFARARVGGPLSCPSAARSVCLLCQQQLSIPRSSIQRGPCSQRPQQRRGLATSPIHSYPQAQAQEANATSAFSPDVTNHYTLFPKTLPNGPPPASSFNIDVGALRREFLQLQGAVHPDKFPQGPDKVRAEALSSRINDAYRTLLDPLSRAQYLLAELHGIDVLAEDGGSKHPLDTETLMEIMDVQEAVEELSSSNTPTAEAEATIDRLRAENATRVEDSVQKLQAAFDSGDIETAQMETVRLRFWYSLRDGLREWEPGHQEIRIVH